MTTQPSSSKTTMLATALLTLVAMSSPSLSAGTVNKTPAREVAIRGFDAVAYFTLGKAIKGKGRFSHDWSGAHWLFASAEDRDAFAADPERYAPQYGGYCAWHVSQGQTKRVDPTAFAIRNGKLYLFYSPGFLEVWKRDAVDNIARADTNWDRLAHERNPEEEAYAR